jgi:ketosteroid isomerase-like protein
MSDVDNLKAAYEAFGKGDIDTVLAMFDDGIEWEEPHLGSAADGIHNGPDEVAKEVFGTIPDEWESFELDPKTFVDGGDTIVVIGRADVVGKKSGKKGASDFAHVWKMRDGKAVRFQLYWDTLALHEAMHDDDKVGYPRRG